MSKSARITVHFVRQELKSQGNRFIHYSLQFSLFVIHLLTCPFFATPWTAACQAFLSITNSLSLFKLMAIESVMQSSHLILCRPLLLLPPILPSIRVFSSESTLHMRWPEYWSFSFSISPSNEHPVLQNGLVGSPYSPRDSQESSPTPQFKSINSLALSLLYSPTLTSIHDYWKNHSFDQRDLCWQSNVSAFEYAVQVGHSFSSKEQMSFNFMAAVTICSDFGARENKVSHSFHCFPIYLPSMAKRSVLLTLTSEGGCPPPQPSSNPCNTNCC